ncbi:hydrolase [Parasphingopyxis algicola]|uniref:hydrolase n=1 Tax=Parasphingopyxis algicola TaxID=2026624 RepID=UPI0015A12662|nr:hydrolase [Parasphingopyxis algicola]QLC24027.1 hydrolase [Parasphingopyxis algicola]
MTEMTEDERDALERAADEPMLEQTERWAKINSGSANLAGLARVAGELADAFAALPGDLELADPVPGEIVRPDGSVVQRETGKNLHVTVRPDAPVQVLLTGHMDTVFGETHPFQELTWLDDNTLNGPGVTDMKGCIALMLSALKAIEASPLAERIGYEVVINSDEEIGSPGSAALLAQAANGKLAALTYEPALPDGTLAGARGGSGNWSIIISGKSAHAGRNPEEGRSALLAAAELALKLEAGIGPGLKVNPAKIEGGGANNVVPDHAVLRLNMRPETLEDQERAHKLLDEAVADISARREVDIHVHGGFGRPPKPIDPEAEKLFGLVKECGADLGLDIAWKSTGGVCDGNNIAACGVPVVDTMGVRGGAIHSPDEFLIVDSLPERAQLSTLVLLRLAQRGRL